MSRFLAWRCDHTGQLFEDEQSYLKQLKKLARARAIQRKLDKALKEIDERVVELQSLSTLAEITDWLNKNGLWIMQQMMFERSREWRVRVNRKKFDKLTGNITFEFRGMCWDGCVSNTHDAPKGKPTNWGQDAGLPKGYPGWKGRFTAHHPVDDLSFESDFFARLGIHLGTGGGALAHHGYEVILFAEEWQQLSENYTYNALVGEPNRL